MVVAVSMRIVDAAAYSDPRDAVSHDWTRRLDRLGVTPIFVPNVLNDPAEYLATLGARGLLLTGGEDVAPAATALSPRDRTERVLLDVASARGLPVFGVCRGLQLMNVYFGGAIRPDVTGAGARSHVAVTHPVDIVIGAAPFGPVRTIVTNSYHRQGVAVGELAPDLTPFAVSGDVVEGLLHRSLPMFGVQWHPERPNPAADFDDVLLKEWLRQCA